MTGVRGGGDVNIAQAPCYWTPCTLKIEQKTKTKKKEKEQMKGKQQELRPRLPYWLLPGIQAGPPVGS